MTFRHFILVILSICLFNELFSQSRKDTLFSSDLDTMVVKTFDDKARLSAEDSYVKDCIYSQKFYFYNKYGKLDSEELYVNSKHVSSKVYYYKKDYYGFFIVDKTQRPRIETRKEFYLNGSLKKEGAFLKGKMNGKYLTYYDNGGKQCDCNYRNGKKDSTQVIYHKNGQVWTEKIYKNGIIWEVVSNFNEAGDPVEKGTLKDGNGTLYIYDEKGILQIIEYYNDGKLIKTEKKNTPQ